jgi:hypothetical protein
MMHLFLQTTTTLLALVPRYYNTINYHSFLSHMIYNHQSCIYPTAWNRCSCCTLWSRFCFRRFSSIRKVCNAHYTLILYLSILNNSMLSAASNHRCFPSSSSFNCSFIFVYSSNSDVLVPTKTLLWSMINCQTRIKLLFRYLFFPCLLISSFASSDSRVQDILVSFIPIVLVKRSTF